jgi:hypothetical protein
VINGVVPTAEVVCDEFRVDKGFESGDRGLFHRYIFKDAVSIAAVT